MFAYARFTGISQDRRLAGRILPENTDSICASFASMSSTHQFVQFAGKLPDGRELSPQIKQALMNKLRLGPLPAASMQPQAAANPASGQGAGGPPRGGC